MKGHEQWSYTWHLQYISGTPRHMSTLSFEIQDHTRHSHIAHSHIACSGSLAVWLGEAGTHAATVGQHLTDSIVGVC
jgi:hypothetical protein